MPNLQGAIHKAQFTHWLRRVALCLGPCAFCLLLSACADLPSTPLPSPSGEVTFSVVADGQTQPFTLPAGLTVREALARTSVALGDLDRVTPPMYTVIIPGLVVTVTRVTEAFTIEQAVLPYSSEIAKSDFIPEGDRRLLQAGQNGLEEITYRTVFEDGVQVSQSVVKRTVLQEPVAEKILVGSQASFTLVPLTGTLAYLNGGNAWLMRQNSGQRQFITSSSDLDGVIFELSPDGQWLLFSRAVTNSATLFNSLWAVSLTGTITATRPLSLPVTNVRYAEWQPGTTTTPTIAYSTYLKIPGAPGWQANNDLWLMGWGLDPKTKQRVFISETLTELPPEGAYSWWGAGYAFSPDGTHLAYAHADSLGVIDLASHTWNELTQFVAYNSHSDWAWYPQLRWSPDGAFIYAVTHGLPFGFEAPEDSTVFNLSALAADTGQKFDLVPRAGMFANPVPSPTRLAFMQAVEPDNSPTSRYRLMVMDRDGSNVRALFPPADQPGLSAAETSLAWSPDARRVAVIYDGNLWLIDPDSGVNQQITGDGQTVRVAWGK